MRDSRHGSTSPQEELTQYRELSEQADCIMWDVASKDPKELSERFDRFNEGLQKFSPRAHDPLIISELIAAKANILNALIALRSGQETLSALDENVLRDLEAAVYATMSKPASIEALQAWVREQLPANYPLREKIVDHFESVVSREKLGLETSLFPTDESSILPSADTNYNLSELSLASGFESARATAQQTESWEVYHKAATSLRSLEKTLIELGFDDLNHLEEQLQIANSAVVDLTNHSTHETLQGLKPGLLSVKIHHIAALIAEKKPDSNPKYVLAIKALAQEMAEAFDCLPEFTEWRIDLHRKLSIVS